eukprot:TRINITY_DN8047_c0_g1_i8.p1 TRINITY_DN8047_c0_g1~~TRINITY_DN8047_c0_g1_i8.p1  ORF type:complete len:1707 (+),score=239.26 TRINITY_DN8047_c0_g1_i8:19-5139(+)
MPIVLSGTRDAAMDVLEDSGTTAPVQKNEDSSPASTRKTPSTTSATGFSMKAIDKNPTWKLELAARIIQRLVIKKLRLDNRTRLVRTALVERLQLEVRLGKGIRLMLCFMALFGLMISADVIETSAAKLKLTDHYRRTFELDKLNGIQKIAELKSYLRNLSAASNTMQVSSSSYFVNRDQVMIVSDPAFYEHSHYMDVKGLSFPVDAVEVSFLAWVQVDAGRRVNLLGRRLDKQVSSLSCWSWIYGPEMEFDFGAHDYGHLHDSHGSADQEVIRTATRAYHPPGMHLVVLVIRQDTVEFWQNESLVGHTKLSRPVTDCIGSGLEVGGSGLLLGMLSFFPWALGAAEIHEIYVQGNTLEFIASGAELFKIKETGFDLLHEQGTLRQSSAETHHHESQQSRSVSHAITNEVIYSLGESGHADDGEIRISDQVPELTTCPTKSAACRYIEGVSETWQMDPLSSAYFYDLLPPSLLGGASAGSLVEVHLERNRHAYSVASFPSSIGPVWSLSFWARASTSGFLIGKFHDPEHDLPCWSVQIEGDKLKLFTSSHEHRVLLAMVSIPEGRSQRDFAFVGTTLLRHFVIVIDELSRVMSVHLDGHQIGADPFRVVGAFRVDCPHSNGTYIAFAHRTPGSQDFIGQLQQFRLYANTVLNDSQILALAEASEDPKTGRKLRQCFKPGEIQDDGSFRDEQFHGCTWYAEMLPIAPQICLSDAVRANCQIACKVARPCFAPLKMAADVGMVWNRIMRLSTPLSTDSSDGRRLAGGSLIRPNHEKFKMCLAESVASGRRQASAGSTQGVSGSSDGLAEHIPALVMTDSEVIVKSCQYLEASRDPRSYVAESRKQSLRPADGALYLLHEYPGMFQNVTDCESLRQSIDSHCAFQVENDWTKHFDEIVERSGQLTISFWVRPSSPNSLNSRGEFTPSIQFLAGVAPPEVFLTVWAEGGLFPKVAAYFHTHNASSGEYLEVGTRLSLDDWTHISVTFGSKDAKGHSELTLVVNGMAIAGDFPESWVRSRNANFLEAISFSSEMLISPVEFRSTALHVSDLQSFHYNEHARMKRRTGPSRSDAERLQAQLMYSREPFQEPSFLVAPPILQQVRIQKSTECSSDAGRFALERMWEQALSTRCHLPFTCDADLKADPTSLLACGGAHRSRHDDDLAPKWFGQEPHVALAGDLEGFHVYTEFLVSITDMPVLVREDRALRTQAYIDQQTTHMAVQLVLFAPEHGIISEVNIGGHLDSGNVEAEYHVRHISSVEGLKLMAYSILGALVVLICCVVMFDTWRRICLQGFTSLCMTARVQLIMDIGIGLVVPAFYVVRSFQNAASGALVKDMLRQLLEVPWSADSLSYAEKEGQFFHALHDLEISLLTETFMHLFAFFVSWAVLLRIMQLTSAHPRIAVLINTVVYGIDDFWHFLILFWLLFMGFCLIAKTLFGPEHHEFETYEETLKSQFLMCLGTVPDDFGTEMEFTIYVVVFNFVMFFLVVNFLLAIIVESYLRVKQDIEKTEAEQEFFTDMGAVMFTLAKRWRHAWPKARTILRVLEPAVAKQHVDLALLREVSGSWNRQSRRAFLDFYGRFDHIAVHERKRGTYWDQPIEVPRKAERTNAENDTLDLGASLAVRSARSGFRRPRDAALDDALQEQSQLQRHLQAQVQEQTALIRGLQAQLRRTILDTRAGDSEIQLTGSNYSESLHDQQDDGTQSGSNYRRLV